MQRLDHKHLNIYTDVVLYVFLSENNKTHFLTFYRYFHLSSATGATGEEGSIT